MKGDRLGPYRVLGELGSGSTATVYLAEVVGEVPELEAGRRVALKLLRPQLESAPRILDRFLQEIRVGRALRHPNVVHLLDAGELPLDGSTRHYLAMEYVAGHTIRDLIGGEGGQPESLCRHVACEVSRGLAAIHGCGAVHRDIKPENIVLAEDEHVKIMDLGVAHLRGGGGRISQTGEFVGSVLYAPPEQFLGPSHLVDGRADLYALGLTLYELATGVHPFARDTIEEVMRLQISGTPEPPGALQPRLSPFFEHVLLRLLRKSPARRFASADDLRRTLEAGEDSPWWRERRRVLQRARPPFRPGPRVRRETAVFGRAHVLARMRTLWSAVTQGQGRVLVIRGEAGIGKSRVVDELGAQLQTAGEDLHVLYGAWPSGGPSTAGGALCTAYREHFGPDGLEEAVAPFLTESPALVRAFAALLRGEPPARGAEPLGTDALHAAFLHVTRALALERPTLLVLEDLQNASPEACAVVAAIAHGIQGCRVLLILTERAGAEPDASAVLPRMPHVGRLVLGRLGPQDVEGLLAESLHSPHLARRLARRMTSLSDGNPLFLFELLQTLHRDGILVPGRGDNAWTLRGTLRDVRCPPRMRDLVHARLAGLAPEDRELLDAAAAFGFEFDPVLLADVLERPRLRVLQALGRLERVHHLVRSRGGKVVFDHHVLQETLYDDLPPLLRRATHAAIGEALRRALDGAEPPGDAAVEICHHLLCGECGAPVLGLLDVALEHLEKNHLSARAVDLLDRVLGVRGLLDGSPRARLLLHKAGLLRLLGRTEQEARVLEEAARQASPKHDPLLASTASARLGDHLRVVGHPDRALRFLSQAIALARRAGSEWAEAEATCCLGVALDDLGRHDEARDAQRRCLAYARRSGDRRAQARARAQLGRTLFRLGHADEALHELRASAALLAETGDLLQQGTTAAELGSFLLALGRYDEARPHVERGLELTEMVGYRAGVAAALADLGMLRQSEGDLQAAESLVQQSLAIQRDCGGSLELGLGLTRAGALELVLGCVGRARVALEEGRARLREVAQPLAEAWTVLHLARVADEEGEHATARDLFAQAHELATRARSARDAACMRVIWALGRFWSGETRAAAEVLDAGDAAWRATDSRDALLLGRCLELALGRVRDEGAARRLLGPPTTPTARYEARALLHAARRDPRDLEAAWHVIVALRDRAPARVWNGFLRGVRVRRTITEAWEDAHAANVRASTE